MIFHLIISHHQGLQQDWKVDKHSGLRHFSLMIINKMTFIRKQLLLTKFFQRIHVKKSTNHSKNLLI